MATFHRLLDFDLPLGQSAFLWGPRKTGKSTWLRTRFPHSLVLDFLETDLFLAMSKRPALLAERLAAADEETSRQPVILDEVQKVPAVLDEVHRLIERDGTRFVLCGSSARKLRRGQANLLGGRAWRFEMFPLTTAELDDWALLDVLQRGLVPSHYLSGHYRRSLRAYVGDYLKEEVFEEGLTRNVPAFSRFLDAVGYTHGELVNYSNIARECGVDGKTVKEYFQILVDTLLGTLIEPFNRRSGRQVITRAPRFYLFDVGVAGALIGRQLVEERGEAFGRALEHLVLMELRAHASYRETDHDIRFWRTKSGLEVDFVLGDGDVAIEVKGSSRVDNRKLRPLQAFVDEYSPREAIVVCNEPHPRKVGNLRILPYREFFAALWAGDIIA